MRQQNDKKRNGESSRRILFRGFFFIITGIAASAVLSACLFYFLLPRAVSFSGFRSAIESRTSQALHRSISIESIHFTWENGLWIKSIAMADAPPLIQKPLLSVGQARIKILFKELLFRRRLQLEIHLDEITLRVVREKSGISNLNRFFFDLTANAKHPTALDSPKPLLLPLSDISGLCRLGGLTVFYDDRLEEKRTLLDKGSIAIHAPSLMRAPLSINVSAAVTHDEKPLPPIEASVEINKLIDEAGAVHVDRAALVMKASAPGIHLDFKADMAQQNLDADFRAKLDSLLPLIHSVLPTPPSLPSTSGFLELTAHAGGLTGDRTVFDIRLRLRHLTVQNLNSKQAVSDAMDIDFTQKGSVSFTKNKGEVQLDSGTLSLNSSRVAWKGILEGIKGDDPRIQCAAGPVIINLHDIKKAANHFLASPLPLDWGSASAPSTVFIDRIDVSGNPILGNLAFQMSGLKAGAGGLRFLSPDRSVLVALRSISVVAPNLQGSIKDFSPQALEVHGSVAISGLKVSGEAPASVDLIKIMDFRFTAGKLRPDKGSLLGIILPFSLSGSVNASGIQALELGPGRLNLPGIILSGDLSSENFINASIQGLHFYLKNFNASHLHLGNYSADLNVNASVPTLRFKGLHPLLADIQQLESRVSFGDEIRLELQADAIDSGKKHLKAVAELFADLKYMKILLPDLLNDFRSLDGKARLQCSLSGKVPPPETLQGNILELLLKPETTALDSVSFSLNLSRASATWQMDPKNEMGIKYLETPVPLTYTFNGDTASGKFSGDIQVKGLSINGSKAPSNPHGGIFKESQLLISGSHQSLRSARLDISLKGKSPNLDAGASLFLDGTDVFLKASKELNLSQWTKFLTGNLEVSVSLPEVSDWSFGEETLLKGGLTAGAEIAMRPDEGARFKIWTKTTGMTLEKNDAFRVRDLAADLSFEKQYAAQMNPGNDPWVVHPLSDRVMWEKPRQALNPSNVGVVNPFGARVQGRLSRSPTLVFGPGQFSFSSLTIPVRRLSADLQFEEGLPRIHHIEAHLLDGSIVGSGGIYRIEERFDIGAQLNFSDLDVKQALGERMPRPGDDDAAISGQLELAFPMVPILNRLMENLHVSLQFNHIGSKAFGKILHLMDPYESNETITSQRRLLRSGTPRWVDIRIRNGILSLDGEVEIKGIPVKIPHLERLNLSAVSHLGRFDRHLSMLEPLLKILRIASDPGPVSNLVKQIE